MAKPLKILLKTKEPKLSDVFGYPEEKIKPLLQTLRSLIEWAQKETTIGDTTQTIFNKAKPTSVEQAIYIGIIIWKILK